MLYYESCIGVWEERDDSCTKMGDEFIFGQEIFQTLTVSGVVATSIDETTGGGPALCTCI